MSGEGFISRWSRRKTESKVTSDAGRDPPPADVVPAQAGSPLPAPQPAAAEAPPESLPPVESLTPDSDFSPYLKPEVDADTKRKAVKMIFQDPRYNVMDGLDVYIDDYSKPDPLPEGWLEQMTQMARLGEYREPDAEAAPEKAPDDPQVPAAPVENPEGEQPSGDAKRESPGDTPDAGSHSLEVRQSPAGG